MEQIEEISSDTVNLNNAASSDRFACDLVNILSGHSGLTR